MTNHTPATPLPWELSINAELEFDVCGPDGGDMVADLSGMPSTGGQDAAYIVYAANAYPKLVEALRGMLESNALHAPAYKAVAAAVLGELGESA